MILEVAALAILGGGGVILALITDKLVLQNTPRKKLIKTKTISINEFNHGEVAKIVGTVKKYKKHLVAPLSKKVCVCYEVKVVDTKKNAFVPYVSEYETVDFLVTQGRSTALVKTKPVRSNIKMDWKRHTNLNKNASNRLENYLRRKGKSSTDFLGMNKNLVFYEGTIELGEKIAVKGKGEWEMKPNPKEQMLIMKGDSKIELHISDDKATF